MKKEKDNLKKTKNNNYNINNISNLNHKIKRWKYLNII